jgi:hypothetical protein
MPLYSARDIQLISFHFSLWQLTISAKILAGVEIDNGNYIGGDLYSAHVDIYYPDWNGDLQNIGYLQETKTNVKVCSMDINMDDTTTSLQEEEEDRGVCMSAEEMKASPVFSVQPRGVSTSKPGIITIFLQNVTPKTYLNVMRHVFTQWGSIVLLVSGVAHVKSPLGVNLSLGIICDNDLDLTKHPMQIVGRSCIVERISTGWSGLTDLAAEVKDRVQDYYSEFDGDIFQRLVPPENEDGKLNGGSRKSKRLNALSGKSMDVFFASSEVVLEWHDF